MLLRLTILLALLSIATAAHAVGIGGEEIEPFSYPCDLSLTQNGGTRTITWNAIDNASYYKVGRITSDETIEYLGSTSGSSFDDTTWSSQECYEYVIIACDAADNKVCSAHVENVGTCFGS